LAFGAFTAGAEDGKMVQVGDEPVIRTERLFERIKNMLVHLNAFAAAPAKKVMVAGMLLDLVLDVPAPKIGLSDDAQVGEQIQGAVYGGFVQIRVTRPNARENILCGKMTAALADDGKDHFALGCQAVSGLPEVFQVCRMVRHGI
jgi:hypothetical protein